MKAVSVEIYAKVYLEDEEIQEHLNDVREGNVTRYDCDCKEEADAIICLTHGKVYDGEFDVKDHTATL